MIKSTTLLFALLQLFAITTSVNAASMMDSRVTTRPRMQGMVEAQDMEGEASTVAQQQNVTEPQTSYVYLPHQLAQAGKLDELKELLEEYPELVNDVDNFGWSLMHEAGRSGSVELAAYLISKNAKLNPRSLEGHTPLYVTERSASSRFAIVGHIQ